ncbi:50S ribosomal protein L13 [Candidatus Woesearchaeota archaeon]|nr:50S ribosomal protein L13 [Candidatus Woesearchaeota archaeon]
MLVDATNMIVGRLGTVIAKKALLGEKIDIVNAEKAVISGKRSEVIAKFKQKVERGTWAKGPHYLRDADRLLKRLIRNMLPYKTARGREAFKNITCWIGVPEQFKSQKPVTFKEADASKLTIGSVSLKEISKLLGGNVE